MRTLGNKVAARNLAVVGRRAGHAGDAAAAGGHRRPASSMAAEVGYPVMLKASWGGGGRGMRVIESDAQLAELLPVARREAQGRPSATTRCISRSWCARRATSKCRSSGDTHGNLVHLFERDCTVQRRNQKVVERAPGGVPDDGAARRAVRLRAADRRAPSNYRNAGTVEFLQDADTGKFYFIEVNPRIQVEHTVTEAVTGIDLVKAQIRIADGARIGDARRAACRRRRTSASARMPCSAASPPKIRRTTSSPDYGKITAYRSPAGFGIRLDAGTAYAGAILTRSYDSLLVKVTAWAPKPEEAIARMHRALWEFRIRGVVTNLRFLDQVITHPKFAHGEYTTKFIDETPELFKWEKKRDRATRILSFIGDDHRQRQPGSEGPRRGPSSMDAGAAAEGERAPSRRRRRARKQKLDELGAGGFAQVDAGAGARAASPTPPCAMRTSRCSPRACARST